MSGIAAGSFLLFVNQDSNTTLLERTPARREPRIPALPALLLVPAGGREASRHWEQR